MVAEPEAEELTAMQSEVGVIGLSRQLWIASLARSLWLMDAKGPLPTTTHQRASEILPLWWGPVIQVDLGDIVTLLPTPLGPMIEAVSKPIVAPTPTGFGPTRVW